MPRKWKTKSGALFGPFDVERLSKGAEAGYDLTQARAQCAWCGAPFPPAAELVAKPGETEEDAWDRKHGWHYANCSRYEQVALQRAAGQKVRP